ncbi:MAG TPA: hypothetical protein VI356_17875 [Myxococcales bacterium]
MLLTIVQFIGGAIVGVFYVTILVAFATRKKAGESPAEHDEEKAPRLDPAS